MVNPLGTSGRPLKLDNYSPKGMSKEIDVWQFAHTDLEKHTHTRTHAAGNSV